MTDGGGEGGGGGGKSNSKVGTRWVRQLQALKLFEGQEDEIGRELQELDEQLIITPTLDTDLKRKVVHPKWGEAIVRGEFGRVRKRFIASRL